MPSIFTRIIQGDIPGRILWSDEVCIAMLDIRPLHEGHVLVIPRAEIDRWTDLDTETAEHLMRVSHAVGKAQRNVIECVRVGLMIAGFEVPHTHVHVVPLDSMHDLNFANADPSVRSDVLDEVAERLRQALRDLGHSEQVDV